jgi:hypothetical protein
MRLASACRGKSEDGDLRTERSLCQPPCRAQAAISRRGISAGDLGPGIEHAATAASAAIAGQTISVRIQPVHGFVLWRQSPDGCPTQ